MSLYDEWTKLTERQTDKSFPDFWKEYCDAESRIYEDILSHPGDIVEGSVKELYERYAVSPALFAGFLDGINSSLITPIEAIEAIEDDSPVKLEIDLEKLFFNMHSAQAEHLYTLPAWTDVLPQEDRERIESEYKRSRTVRKEKEPGRNDPCPCGSGLKYKKCCGKTAV